MRPIVLLFVGFFIVVIAGVFAMIAIIGGGTEYCPWAHRSSTDFNCSVKDNQGPRLLIEHLDVDTNEATLSIYEPEKGHTWIEHPRGTIKKFALNLNKNTIFFDNSDPNALLVNNEKFPIRRLE